jgi:hypothetical protein
MSRPRVSDLAARAVREGSDALVVDALVLAARACAAEEEAGDVRDGLIDMPLPFRAAALLSLDADAALAEALAALDGRAAELLAQFGARPDRADIGVMGWRESREGGAFRFVSG